MYYATYNTISKRPNASFFGLLEVGSLIPGDFQFFKSETSGKQIHVTFLATKVVLYEQHYRSKSETENKIESKGKMKNRVEMVEYNCTSPTLDLVRCRPNFKQAARC